jgi:hypothetical protein
MITWADALSGAGRVATSNAAHQTIGHPLLRMAENLIIGLVPAIAVDRLSLILGLGWPGLDQWEAPVIGESG